LDETVKEGDTYRFGTQEVRVFETPGHTSGHISLWFPEASVLFSGDTLFALGCGRLFEGTPAQMWHSLLKLRLLPDETRVYCGHEYTLSNAKFAVTVDPNNSALKERAADIAVLRDSGKPTIPTTLGVEKATNPFLRADDADVAAAVGLAGADPVEVFGEIRRRKDTF
jgi:hydroxyacylglutathione hydrolase